MPAVQVFSFGVVLWEIVAQADPVQGWQNLRWGPSSPGVHAARRKHARVLQGRVGLRPPSRLCLVRRLSPHRRRRSTATGSGAALCLQAVGACPAEACMARVPASSPADAPMRQRLRRVPEQCPPAVVDLIDACMDEDPARRPDIGQAYHLLRGAANAHSLALADVGDERTGFLSGGDSSAPPS